MRRDYKAVLFGNGTMGERHRKFFEYSDVQFLKIFDLEDLEIAQGMCALRSLMNLFLKIRLILP